jgi:hypothetical protein
MSDSVRSRLIARLPAGVIRRVSLDFGGGVGLACAAVPLAAPGWAGSRHWAVLLLVFPAALGALIAGVLCYAALSWTAGALRQPRVILRSAAAQPTVIAFTLVGLGALVLILLTRGGPGRLGTLLGGAIAAELPAILVAVTGGWACLLARRRFGAAPARWRRRIPDGVAVLVTALVSFFLARPGVLATEPAAGLLVPLAGWASFRTWRAMGRSGRLAVRAAADIVFSLLLGADLVLFLAWLANLLDLPAGEVAVLRDGLEWAGGLVDLPWWLWAGLYAVLAAASLAVALRPEALAAVRTWGDRLRVVPSAGVAQRVLSGVHIGLAVTVLLALAVPPALDGTLGRRVQAQYTLAVRRAVTAEADRAAYAEIRRRFTAPGTPPPMSPLITLLDRLHRISPPPPGRDEATGTERDLARRLGQLQAAALRVTPPPGAAAAAEADEAASTRGGAAGTGGAGTGGAGTGSAGTGGAGTGGAGTGGPGSAGSGPGPATAPAGGPAARAGARLGQLDAQRKRARTVTRLADQAGELAAAAVAAAIQLPGLGDNEVAGILTEYLSGLVESGPLSETFAAWARKLAGRTAPPAAGQLVVPDPDRLEDAALLVLIRVRFRVPVADPLAARQADQRTLREPAAAAAVDLANQARFLAEGGAGPCAGCARPLRPGEEPGEGHDDHPVEPRELAP